jgi:Flp pilus assembly protein TadD
MTIHKATILIILVVAAQPLVFAEETQTALGNFGYLEYGAAPENKKGTTPLDAPISALVEPRLPRTTAIPVVVSAYGDPATMTTLQQQARRYREQGGILQQQGDIDGALGVYQKAMQIDPAFVPVYNDIGVMYEAKGMLGEAAQSYLKAIEIDPNFVGAYSNLALLAESTGRLEIAAQYWQRRIDLGYAGDPWVEKARIRLNDIKALLDKRTQGLVREQEIARLINDVAVQKAAPKPAAAKAEPAKPAPVASASAAVTPAPVTPATVKPAPAAPATVKTASAAPATVKPTPVAPAAVAPAAPKAATPTQDEMVTAQKRLAEANAKFRQGDYLTAYMDALEAQALDPTNTNINKLVDLLQKKLMSSR